MHISPDFISDIQRKQSNVSHGCDWTDSGESPIPKNKSKADYIKRNLNTCTQNKSAHNVNFSYLCYIEQFEMLHLMKPVQINFTWLLYIKFILIKLPL